MTKTFDHTGKPMTPRVTVGNRFVEGLPFTPPEGAAELGVCVGGPLQTPRHMRGSGRELPLPSDGLARGGVVPARRVTFGGGGSCCSLPLPPGLHAAREPEVRDGRLVGLNIVIERDLKPSKSARRPLRWSATALLAEAAPEEGSRARLR